ncbi:unnamed protein product [Paramecium pentaurelia]|uniref:Calcium-dependent protein kinase n=1 Tax=Paramecium pentaurelia TaxID=43138 RepID=A0A8S1TWE9_9CILI|nr:unnamed protein product [Paramecium pentaurelia]
MGCLFSKQDKTGTSFKDSLKKKISQSKKQAAEIRVKTQENNLNTSKYSFNLQVSKSLEREQLGSNLDLKINEQDGSVFKNYTLIDSRFKGCQNSLINYCIVSHNLTQSVRYIRQLNWDCLTKPAIVEYVQKKKLEHINLPEIYEIYSDPKNYYLIEDYCSGNTLSAYLRENGSVSEQKGIQIMYQMLTLFEYLHSQHLYHGELQLESFMFSDESQNPVLKLVDIEPLFSKTVYHKEGEQVYYYSPEFCKTRQKQKQCDIWAIGMIGYQLLTNYHPQKSGTQLTIQQITKNIIRGGMRLDCIDFERFSDNCKSFIRKLLTYESKQRISIQQALETTWIKQINNSQKTVEAFQQMRNVKKLKNINNVQACILLLMVNHFNQQQKLFFASIFNTFDTNRDQKISFDELQEAYRSLYPGQNYEEIIELFKKVDFDKNGFLDFHEFIIAAVDKASLLTNQHLLVTFKMIDKNHSGKISIDEILNICSLDYNCVKFNFDKTSKDQNNNMTFTQFKELMLSLL